MAQNLWKEGMQYLDVISFTYTGPPQFVGWEGGGGFKNVSLLDKRFKKIEELPWKRG